MTKAHSLCKLCITAGFQKAAGKAVGEKDRGWGTPAISRKTVGEHRAGMHQLTLLSSVSQCKASVCQQESSQDVPASFSG